MFYCRDLENGKKESTYHRREHNRGTLVFMKLDQSEAATMRMEDRRHFNITRPSLVENPSTGVILYLTYLSELSGVG